MRADHCAGPASDAAIRVEPYDAGLLVLDDSAGNAGRGARGIGALAALERDGSKPDFPALLVHRLHADPVRGPRFFLGGGAQFLGFRVLYRARNLATATADAAFDTTGNFFHRDIPKLFLSGGR